MTHTLATRVPHNPVKGVDKMLDQNDVAMVIGKPVRWVREHLLKTRLLRAVKMGGNSWRIRPEDLERLIERGNLGFNSSPSSGSYQS